MQEEGQFKQYKHQFVDTKKNVLHNEHHAMDVFILVRPFPLDWNPIISTKWHFVILFHHSF